MYLMSECGSHMCRAASINVASSEINSNTAPAVDAVFLPTSHATSSAHIEFD